MGDKTNVAVIGAGYRARNLVLRKRMGEWRMELG
jgi:hypothetical protein